MNDIRFELPEINSWRLFNKGVSQHGIVEMVESWEVNGYRFGSVCIDDGWTTDGRLGDWVPDPVRFPDFKGLVDWIHRKNYAVRLWVAPAQFHPETQIAKKAFPDATLKNKAGQPARYIGLGTYRIDPRSVLGQSHIRETMQRLVRDYQVDAFKVDFPPFYEPGDEFYNEAGFDFNPDEARSMVSEFYRLVRDSAREVNPAVRICGAKNIAGCQPYFDDIICGDLVGQSRATESIGKICKALKDYSEGHPLVPWLEMVWGEGSDSPKKNPEWRAGCLEFIAISINYGLKIEHSFLPFEYPNQAQIRGLTNLYGPRNNSYKVLVAGRHSYSVTDLMAAGAILTPATRFLVAPENDQVVALQTAELGTSALQWKCRDVLTNSPVRLRARNEFWGGNATWCQVQFEAEAHQLYELWHEGNSIPYYRELFNSLSIG